MIDKEELDGVQDSLGERIVVAGVTTELLIGVFL